MENENALDSFYGPLDSVDPRRGHVLYAGRVHPLATDFSRRDLIDSNHSRSQPDLGL